MSEPSDLSEIEQRKMAGFVVPFFFFLFPFCFFSWAQRSYLGVTSSSRALVTCKNGFWLHLQRLILGLDWIGHQG